ncbi:MAG: hypothetical protein CBC65_010225 [Rhodothermaceae bacterium TMED105]|nr:MAG: hypothetical protein CBC65_010225 [Rhodothermaceae bacterium TMED105]
MSTLRVTNVAPLSGTSTDFMEGLTKAWCSWDMANTGSPYDSFNVSSLNDDGGTVNTINYTNNNSSQKGQCATSSGNNHSNGVDNIGEAATKVYRPETGSCRVYTTNTDPEFQCFKMIGDLA